MQTIKKLSDIERLRVRKLVDKNLLNHLETYFRELHGSLGNGDALEKFSLEEHGYIVILESGDDARGLADVGLNPEEGGILGSCPEWVEVKTLDDGTNLYQIGVLYNNEYMMIFYSKVSQFDEEIENFLLEHSGYNQADIEKKQALI